MIKLQLRARNYDTHRTESKGVRYFSADRATAKGTGKY